MPSRHSRGAAAPASRAVAAILQSQPTAPVVSQRLCDVLLSFPAAAIGGVQWQVLVRKYEERYSTRLDLAELGHSSPLAAATALLWDVGRILDKEDTDNPIVGVEDAVAMTPQPGLLGSWPSLYCVLCDLVRNDGRDATPEEARPCADGTPPRCLLLSQLRPLMERHWHASFDESSLGFLNEEGSFAKLKKMKHLLNAMLRWREQRRACQKPPRGAVDEALVPHLQVAPSSTHNDLLLICFPDTAAALAAAVPASAKASAPPLEPESPRSSAAPEAPAGASVGRPDVSNLQLELERLRCENQELRMRNHLLEQSGAMPATPTTETCEAPEDFLADVFDNFSEPPPEARTWSFAAVDGFRKRLSDFGGATDLGSECSFDMGSTASSELFSTPFSAVTSGSATPGVSPQPGLAQHGCAFVPVWFQVLQSEEHAPWAVIPRGIVKTACEHFERIAGNQLL